MIQRAVIALATLRIGLRLRFIIRLQKGCRVSLRSLIHELPPAYFAMVMATGIVSIAAYGLGPASIGWALFYLNLMLYAALAALHGLRLVLFPRRCIADLPDTTAGPGYFTWIAATAVLGSQCTVLGHAERVATALFIFAVALRLVLSYAVFTALALRRHKRALEAEINGGVTSRGCHAGTGRARHASGRRLGPAGSARTAFRRARAVLAGGVLYLWLGALIFYRYCFFALAPGDLVPTYWINMGAMAISTLAGSLLIANSGDQAPYLQSLRPFLEGFTLFYWAGGTWWLPLLLILGVGVMSSAATALSMTRCTGAWSSRWGCMQSPPST